MDALVAALAYLNARFENPDGLTGTYAVTIRGPQVLSRLLAITDAGLASVTGRTADASLVIDHELLVQMLARKGAVDLQLSEHRGRIETQGNVELLDFLRGLMSEPPAENARLLQRVDALARERAPLGVERLRRPSIARLQRALAELTPVVVEGSLDAEQLAAWTPSALAQRFSTELVSQIASEPAKTMAELVAALREREDDRRVYSGGFLLSDAMRRELVPRVFDEPRFFPYAQLWMGRAESDAVPVTKLHRDCVPSVLTHLYGHKRLVLFSPDQAELLYARRKWVWVQHAAVKPWAPDYQRYPSFRSATPIIVDLEPGDVMVIPTGWWHEVHAIGGPVVSVSSAYVPHDDVLGSSKAF